MRRLLGIQRAHPPAPPEPPQSGARLIGAELKPGGAVGEEDLPPVSIVILNYNGLRHLKGCFDSLSELDYPSERIEVVLVDNGSSDESVATVKRDHAWVRLIENEKNLGFSAGCNQGARAAEGARTLVFLNNDMRVEPSFVRELVSPIVRGECQATTGKMLSWDGKRMNSAGGGMNFHGIGIQKGYEKEPGPEHDRPARTLFACGGAMAVDRTVFLEAGGFDEDFFAYYEDVDLGWRLWVLGHEVHYAPQAVAYHHHSSTSKTFPKETVRLLQVRNPLLACFKNYDDAHLAQVFPAALSLAVRRMLLISGLADDTPYRIERQDVKDKGAAGRLLDKAKRAAQDSTPLTKVAVADLIGINDLLGNWDHWERRRADVQARRRRPDDEIFQLFHKPLWCIEDEPAYRSLHFGIARRFGIDTLFDGLTEQGPEPNK
ncbi:MAG: glycosyltransferase family 2 protein [Planctomycetota bacterium]